MLLKSMDSGISLLYSYLNSRVISKETNYLTFFVPQFSLYKWV